MHQQARYLSFILIFPFFLSCSDSLSDLKTDDVSLQVDDEYLRVRNQFNHSIYYFAVESGTAAAIQWAPISSEENQVRAGKTKEIVLDSIHAFEPGDEIIFYFWSEKEPGNDNIKFQRIGTLFSEDG